MATVGEFVEYLLTLDQGANVSVIQVVQGDWEDSFHYTELSLPETILDKPHDARANVYYFPPSHADPVGYLEIGEDK